MMDATRAKTIASTIWPCSAVETTRDDAANFTVSPKCVMRRAHLVCFAWGCGSLRMLRAVRDSNGEASNGWVLLVRELLVPQHHLRKEHRATRLQHQGRRFSRRRAVQLRPCRARLAVFISCPRQFVTPEREECFRMQVRLLRSHT